MMNSTDVANDSVVDRQFSVETGSELLVENVGGSVLVRVGEPGTIVLHAEKHGQDRAVANTEIECVQEGNGLRVRTRRRAEGKKILLNFGSNLASVDYELLVPPDCRVQGKGVSSSVEIMGLRAPVVAETVSGGVTLSDIAGDVIVTTVSGAISATTLQGSLALHSTSGNATVSDSVLTGCTLNSVSGTISLDTPLITGSYYVARTTSGSLRLHVPAGTGATAQLKTVSGNVSVRDVPVQTIRDGARHWQGRIGGGGATVEMSSVSGSLQIVGDGSAPTTVLHEERGAHGGESLEQTTDVLRALQNGDLSVEDALSRLGE